MRTLVKIFEANAIKLAGIAIVCATIATMTGKLDEAAYAGIVYTALGYAFGYSHATVGGTTNGG